jgi:hypothetical protein
MHLAFCLVIPFGFISLSITTIMAITCPRVIYWLWDTYNGQLVVNALMPLDGIIGEVKGV